MNEISDEQLSIILDVITKCDLDDFLCKQDIIDMVRVIREEREKVAELQSELDRLTTLRPIEELGQDDGDALLWYVPLQEAPIVGSCLDEHFDSYYQTHWSPLPRIKDV